MIKFLLIFFLVSYLIIKVGGYLIRTVFITMGPPQTPHTKRQSRKVPDSDLNIDYVPDKSKKRSDKDYDGGEYVDYEEVKPN